MVGVCFLWEKGRKLIRVREQGVRGCGQEEAGGVDAVGLGERGKVMDDVVPFWMARQTTTGAPLLSHLESVTPIGKLEWVVVGEIFGHGFLHGGDSLEVVEMGLGVEHSIVGHEGSCLFDLLGIAVEDVGCGLVTIDFLGHIDIMWLLPNEEGADIGRCFTCPGVGHLHPSDAFESLTFGYLASFGIGGLIVPFKDVGKILLAVPQGEMDGMPPGHL